MVKILIVNSRHDGKFVRRAIELTLQYMSQLGLMHEKSRAYEILGSYLKLNEYLPTYLTWSDHGSSSALQDFVSNLVQELKYALKALNEGKDVTIITIKHQEYVLVIDILLR